MFAQGVCVFAQVCVSVCACMCVCVLNFSMVHSHLTHSILHYFVVKPEVHMCSTKGSIID